MFDTVRNVYCVGRNYKAHAEELGNELPKEPLLFTKPTHALVPMDGRTVRLPGSQGAVHYEAELVIHIGRAYEAGLSADQLVDKMALGIDFTLRDVQSVIKDKGLPWLPAKGFLHSAPLGGWLEFPGSGGLTGRDFTLSKNGREVQRGNASRMIFDIQTIIDYCARHYGLGAGDVIFTGTPEGVGPVSTGDYFELHWGDEPAGTCVLELA
ncbi:MAG: fumarylacetoacetate hydrolase [Paenibacillaceae bacterium]|jgi:2-keto-4-pentenoate hydratase/2-oxohepta-3-ene-1,7-dioic acid hydratase in catechol pathway|nr:fumarylacetoacetate hydrolase [Paenibacillaceae bacterium]